MQFEPVVLNVPEGIVVDKRTSDEVSLHFKAVQNRRSSMLSIKFWMVNFAYLIGLIAVSAVLGRLFSGGFGFSVFVIISLIYLVYKFVGSLRKITTKVTLTTTPSAVILDSKNYDRNLWGGFHLSGYKTVSGMGHRIISFSYGGINQDTHHLVYAENAEKVVDFLNRVAKEVV